MIRDEKCTRVHIWSTECILDEIDEDAVVVSLVSLSEKIRLELVKPMSKVVSGYLRSSEFCLLSLFRRVNMEGGHLEAEDELELGWLQSPGRRRVEKTSVHVLEEVAKGTP